MYRIAKRHYNVAILNKKLPKTCIAKKKNNLEILKNWLNVCVSHSFSTAAAAILLREQNVKATFQRACMQQYRILHTSQLRCQQFTSDFAKN